MAQQGPLEGSTSHLHLERVFHLTSPVLVLHGLAWRPEHLNCLRQLGHRQDIRSSITFPALNLITSPSPFRATRCSSVWNRFPNHVPKCHLSVMTPPGTFPATRNMAEAPSRPPPSSSPDVGFFFNRPYVDLPSLVTWHLCRMSVACSTIHGNSGLEQKWNSQLDSNDQKRSTLVTSSTHLIPCESATAECSNSVLRDPRRFAISLNTSTIAGS